MVEKNGETVAIVFKR